MAETKRIDWTHWMAFMVTVGFLLYVSDLVSRAVKAGALTSAIGLPILAFIAAVAKGEIFEERIQS